VNEGENGNRFAEMMKKDLPQVIILVSISSDKSVYCWSYLFCLNSMLLQHIHACFTVKLLMILSNNLPGRCTKDIPEIHI
jgi:hypothetical protein